MKISELTVGSSVKLTLLVKNADKKTTKPPGNKPFLQMTLTDGESDIGANKWDHYSDHVPTPNMILDVNAKVGEYQGKKQLTISGYSVNTEADPTDFIPKGDFDVSEYFVIAETLIADVANEHLRDVAMQIINNDRNVWAIAPAAKGVHHAFVGGNLKHSVDTAIKAKALAELISGCSVDLCVVGALLHDIGKLDTYRFNGVVIEMSEAGILLNHIPLGIMIIERYRTAGNSEVLDLLQHIISSHHGELEYGSPVTPKFIEAFVVHFADELDAKTQTIIEESKKLNEDAVLTEKIWTLGNQQVFTPQCISRILNK